MRRADQVFYVAENVAFGVTASARAAHKTDRHAGIGAVINGHVNPGAAVQGVGPCAAVQAVFARIAGEAVTVRRAGQVFYVAENVAFGVTA